MKSGRLIILMLAFISFNLELKAGFIEKRYNMGNYSLEKQGRFSMLRFENSFLTNRAGEPALPYFNVNLLLEPGQTAISIEFSGEELTEIPGEHTLYPYQHSIPINPNEDARKHELVINEIVYQQQTAYPELQTGHLSTQYLHGCPVATCTFTPVVYYPAQKRIMYYKRVVIKIKTVNEERIASHLTPSVTKNAFQLIKKAVQNPELLSLFPPVLSDTSDYQVLIVAPELFSTHFNTLMEQYYIRGMKSKVITTVAIYANYTGQDNQEKIRNCIIYEYQNNHIEHVVLAGDNELLPARGFWAEVQSSSVYTDYNIPSDIYYAALDGNWNTDGDDKWAEPDEDDLYPELSVGRLTASTTAELDIMTGKSIHYQNFPVIADCRKPLMVGEKLWNDPLTWGGDYLDLLIGEHSDNGYTTQGIPSWHDIQKLYDRDLPAPWILSDLLLKINAGASFLHQSGHSNTTYLMRMYNSTITDENFSQVNGIDHNYIPIYSHGCYCAAFDYNDCIAERMVNINNFAVAFVGNSRYGWFNEGTTEGPSEHLHREFVSAMYGEHTGQIGAAHTLSKINTAPWVNAPGQWEEGALRWCFYTCNVIGDPAMFIWTDKPMNLTVSHEDSISILSASLQIHCDTLNSPVEGLMCIVLKDSIMIGSSITNTTGNAVIPLSLESSDTVNLTVIVNGYNCLPDTSYVKVMPMGSISGNITYNNLANTPLDSVIVYLIQQGDTLSQSITDSTGHYIITNIPAGTYQIKINCTHTWGGANSSDALLVMRHFVHISLLNGLSLMASDIDHNNITNALDAFAVQKRFVMAISYFPAGDWIFENKTVNVGLMGETFVNIKGLCMGDVNNSFTPY